MQRDKSYTCVVHATQFCLDTGFPFVLSRPTLPPTIGEIERLMEQFFMDVEGKLRCPDKGFTDVSIPLRSTSPLEPPPVISPTGMDTWRLASLRAYNKSLEQKDKTLQKQFEDKLYFVVRFDLLPTEDEFDHERFKQDEKLKALSQTALFGWRLATWIN
jgi:hypothetical protein